MLAQVMLPGDANSHGNVHGGTLMKLADTAGGTCASRHTRSLVVTVVMDSMTFEQPVLVGDLVMLHAEVTWTGTTSIETRVTIEAENVVAGEVRHISTAYFVYVGVGPDGSKVPVRPLAVTTPEEQAHWDEAVARRALRLQAQKLSTPAR